MDRDKGKKKSGKKKKKKKKSAKKKKKKKEKDLTPDRSVRIWVAACVELIVKGES